MSILQEILKWSKTLPLWQQDAVARLYSQGEFTSEDIDDLYALLTDAHGLPDPAGRKPKPLADTEVAAPQVSDKNVQLIAIKNLENVNAIAPNHRLPIHPTGLSIIYGQNGSGKSGYSRVFKKACKARDQREKILPNANLAALPAKPPQATFEITVDGQPEDVTWIQGVQTPELLSTIAIFDSHCARAYVDNHGDFAYVPYGLDIIEGLVALCKKLSTKITDDIKKTTPNLDQFSALSQTQTKVSKLLSALSHKTKPEEVNELATLTDADVLRLETLNSALSEADPKLKAQLIRNQIQRFTNLANSISAVELSLNKDVEATLVTVRQQFSTTKQAAELASKQFRETPGLIEGTGNAAWKALFDAARAFSAESHSHKDFPILGPESTCPLCQNTLGQAGADRLLAFDNFYQQAAEKAFAAAAKAVGDTLGKLRSTQLDIGLDGALQADLQLHDQALVDQLIELQAAIKRRHAGFLSAWIEDIQWDAVPILPSDNRKALDALINAQSEVALTIESSVDEGKRALLIAEKAELEARQSLFEIKDIVLEAVTRLVDCKKLEACSNATSTTALSKKSTELSQGIATEDVAKALNHELKYLNVHDLKIIMKPETVAGKMRFKLVLQTVANPAMAAVDILSEGEQRAIAIASFLAEVSLNNKPGAVIFDDPVSSLDHRRRFDVASRLVAESKIRQVIVLTHDIYFLLLLQHEAERQGTEFLSQSIRRTHDGYGVHSDKLPFDSLNTKARVGVLRAIYQEAQAAHNKGDEEEVRRHMQRAYTNLRITWERAVEEVLFDGVVTRFAEGVSTQKIKGVVVEDSDYIAIDAGMTKCSKYVAHDAAPLAQITFPHPSVLQAEIEALETWRAAVEKRKVETRNRRA